MKSELAQQAGGAKLLTHVPTGFTEIDRTFGGLRLGCATELLAATGDGKSAFARQVCEAAAREGAGVIWWCGEDPEDATAERYLADGTGITATEMGRLDVSPEELARVGQAAREAQEWAARIDVKFESFEVEDVLSTVASTTHVGGAPLKLVVIDYIQICSDSQALEGEIAKLCRHLNQQSGERRIASLLLSQVATHVGQRGRETYLRRSDVSGFTPGLGDTEYARRAEKVTKAVWSLVRPGRWRREMGEDAEDDRAELHVRKASFGPCGFVELGWDGPGCRFVNL